MCSEKAFFQTPPYNPETGDTYRSRERSCAGEKIEHHNVYKRHKESYDAVRWQKGRCESAPDNPQDIRVVEEEAALAFFGGWLSATS